MTNKKEMVIYYFSATGNSLKLSLDIASRFDGAELIKIDVNTKKDPARSKMIGFIFPVYMGGLPDIVRKFLNEYPFVNDVYYFSIATYYTYKGCAMSVVHKILSDRGVSLNYGNYLPSVGNCLKEYEVSPTRRLKILKQAEVQTENLIEDLMSKRVKRSSTYCRLSDLLHKGLFNAIFNKSRLKFTVEGNCVNCRVCEKVCPTNNILFENGFPQWRDKCEACHACVHWCPQNAVSLGKSKGRLQYHHPGVKKSMLLKLDK